MFSVHVTSLFTFFSRPLVTVASTEKPLLEEIHKPSIGAGRESVAVVGAGISGTLFAFELQEWARPSTRYDVTIFERESNVGGRIQSVSLPQNTRITAEAGSSNFYAEDWCITQAIKNVGLEIDKPDPNVRPRTIGIWNGSDLSQSSTCAVQTPSWRDVWKYGLSPWRWSRAVRVVSDRWNSFASLRIVDNVTQELERYALERFVTQSATRYLDEARVSQRYSSNLIDPCTRTRFLQALPNVHGLAALMAAQESPIGPIRGGNRRLVERLFKLSNSELRLDTHVIKIGPGQSHRYKVTYSEQSSPTSNLAESQEFDNVIIAAPLRTADIDLGSLSDFDTAALPQYSDVHVTSFLTPAELSPSFFNLSSEAAMTDDIMVTTHASESVDLYSISRSWACWIDREFCYPGHRCDQLVCENLYRVVSRERIEDGDLIGMIGGHFNKGTPLHEQNMSWVHRQAWPSAVPAHRSDATPLQQVQIAPGLFYLGGAEEIISSMEMSCRMGKNVAERLYYGL